MKQRSASSNLHSVFSVVRCCVAALLSTQAVTTIIRMACPLHVPTVSTVSTVSTLWRIPPHQMAVPPVRPPPLICCDNCFAERQFCETERHFLGACRCGVFYPSLSLQSPHGLLYLCLSACSALYFLVSGHSSQFPVIFLVQREAEFPPWTRFGRQH